MHVLIVYRQCIFITLIQQNRKFAKLAFFKKGIQQSDLNSKLSKSNFWLENIFNYKSIFRQEIFTVKAFRQIKYTH